MIRAENVQTRNVLFLDHAILNSDPGTIATMPQPSVGAHNFVVFHKDGDLFYVTPLTTQNREERLLIKTEWRLGGLRFSGWRNRPIFLGDGANILIVTSRTMLAAALTDREYILGYRRAITPAGLDAILYTIWTQRGRMHNPPWFLFGPERNYKEFKDCHPFLNHPAR